MIVDLLRILAARATLPKQKQTPRFSKNLAALDPAALQTGNDRR